MLDLLYELQKLKRWDKVKDLIDCEMALKIAHEHQLMIEKGYKISDIYSVMELTICYKMENCEGIKILRFKYPKDEDDIKQ